MATEKYTDSKEVAAQAAADAVTTLKHAIEQHGKASWALAGGTSPLTAYAELARRYSDALDWSKVTVLIGDERCVAVDHPDSNWGQITKVLFGNELIGRMSRLVPQADLGAELGAKKYDELINNTLVDENGELHIDLLWLGVGEDGHTLSLFPGYPEIAVREGIVLPVHNSPKPPSDRMTLSFNMAVNARKLVIFAVGAAKKDALATARHDPQLLPIGRIAQAASDAGNDVVWLYDQAAAWSE